MSNCIDCNQPILPTARRCHQCGAAQNWRRFLNDGLLFVTCFLSLISIWIAPPIKELYEAKRANIHVSVLSGDYHRIVFMISNTGNRPAGLTGVELYSKLGDKSKSWYLNSDHDNKLIEPGKAYIVTASNGTSLPEVLPHEIRGAYNRVGALKFNCNLVIKYIQFDGSKTLEYYPFPTRQAFLESEFS